jgi:hypothetical protein
VPPIPNGPTNNPVPNLSEVPRRHRTRKSGLRAAQIRVLIVLKDVKGPLSRADIVERADVDIAALGDALGSISLPIRKKREAKCGYCSLLTLGYVTETILDIVGRKERCYEITDKGREVLSEYVM